MEENKKQNKGTFLLVLSILLVLGAIFTLLPVHLADDKCLFGYDAACPFTPISSILLIAGALFVNLVRKKQYISK
jgi:hypothetical protein